MDLEPAIGVARVGIGCALVWATARRWSASLHLAGGPGSTPGSSLGEEFALRWLATGLLATWLVATIVALLGLAGWLSASGLLAIATALFIATLVVRRKRPAPLLPPRGAARIALLGPALLAAPILLWDVGWRLPAAATDWDALTYHLYMPVRWLQAGELFHVPTVFGDPAAAFAPQNGALLFTWWIALLGGDSLTTVVNVIPAVILSLSLYGLAVRCGVSAENAALAGAALFWVGPMRSAIFEARVDVPMLAFFAASLLFVVRTLDAGRRPPWLAAGLATGLAAGTKVVGLTLIGPQALLIAVLLLVRREFTACAGFLTACVAGGGWWFVSNIAMTGNPLFPLDLELAGLHLLNGAIPFEALAGQFHAPLPDLLGRVLPHFYGIAAMCMTLVGALALLGVAVRPGATRAARMLVAGIALYWVLFYFFRLPHNTETRFLLPVVALALIGWSWLIEPLRRRSPWLMRAAWGVTCTALCFDIERLPQWRAALASPAETGVSLAIWIPLGLATTAALWVAAMAHAQTLSRTAAATGLLGLAISIGLGQHLSIEGRPAHHATSRFRTWSEAMQHVDRLDPADERRVAYTGLNLPYALTGPRLARHVRYVNTQGALGDGFYDFWLRDPVLANRQKPGLYRGGGRDDYGAWLRNLDAARIDWLAVFRLHPQERYIGADEDGFPIEREWAASHPERFALVEAGSTFSLYRLRSTR